MNRAAMAAILWALGAGAARGDPPPAGEDAPFGVAEARALLPEAASMPPTVLDQIVNMGAMARAEDLAALGDFPLSLQLLLLDARDCHGGAAAWLPLPDFTFVKPDLTPTDLRAALRPVLKGSDGVLRPKYRFDSFLLDEYLVEVTCKREGNRAEGTALFRIPGTLEGTIEWTAVRTDAGWSVLRLWWPKCRWGAWRRGARWTLLRGNPDPALGTSSPGHLAVRTTDLARVSSLGPPEKGGALDLALTPRGRLLTTTGASGLTDLEDVLTRHAYRSKPDPDGSSATEVALRVDAAVPWELVGWVLHALERHERPFRRISFAVASERESHGGKDAEGALSVHVPPRAAAEPVRSSGLRVMLRAHDSTVSNAAAFAAFADSLAKLPARDRHATIDVPAPGVRSSHVLRMTDLLFRAGAASVVFTTYARPLDAVPSVDPGTWEWLWAYTRSHPPRPGVQLEVPGVGLVGPSEPPPVERDSEKPAGYRRPR